MTRAEKMLKVRRLRAAGLTAGMIADKVGIPASTVRNWWGDATCLVCGDPVEASSGPPSELCQTCADQPTAPHGTRTRYHGTRATPGCRCDECRRAQADYMRGYMPGYRARQRAAA